MLARQAVRIGGEMGRHPVDHNAQPGLVRTIDKTRKAFGVAKPCGRRVKTGGLVAPARIVRMFADGHKFDVRETHVHDIRDQTVGQRVPGQEATLRIAVP